MTQLASPQLSSAQGDTVQAATVDTQFQTGKVLVIVLGHFIHDIFSSFLAPLLPLLIQKLSLSLTMAGALVFFQQIPSLVNPLLGLLADRGRLRWLVILAPTITAAGMCMVGIAPNYAVLSMLLLAVGLSIAVWHTSTPPIIARAAGRRVGQGMSYFMLGGSMAYTVGPILAVAAVSWWGLAGIWRLFPLGLAVSALLFWQTRDLQEFQRAGAPRGGSWSQSWQVLRPVLLPVAGILVTQGFMSIALSTYLPTFMASQGASLWVAGGSLSIFEVAGAAGTLFAGALSDRFSRRRVLLVALLTAPLLMLVFLYVQGWILIPALLAVGFATLSTTPVLMALVQDYSRDHPATANGLYFAINFASRSLIILLVGAVADRFGLQATFFGCALVGFLALPFVWFLPEARLK